MALSLYRRHREACEGRHQLDSRSGEFEERTRGWKHCGCLIFASGTLGRRFSRRCLNTDDWDKARQAADQFEKVDSWAGVPAAPAPEPAPETPRISITDACEIFITNRASAQIAAATLRKYRTFVKQLSAYADERGYVMLDQFTPTDADRFYAGLKLGTRTKGKRLGTLRAFFRFAAHRKWIAETPISPDIRPPIGSSKSADKMPFTDEEVARIREACDRPPRPIDQRDRVGGNVGCQYKNDQGTGSWTGEDLKDLIELMLHTGFRISDATLFDISRLHGNKLMIRAQKNGNHVFVWIPDAVRNRLNARAKRHGRRPFIVGRSQRLETVTNVWRRRLAQAFEAAGAFDQPPTPHRFRHTFARILLEKGVPVPDVADLMGDDEKTVRTHYAAWVTSRQDRLTAILQNAFSDQSQPRQERQ